MWGSVHFRCISCRSFVWLPGRVRNVVWVQQFGGTCKTWVLACSIGIDMVCEELELPRRNIQGAVSGEAGVQQLPGAWKSSLHSQERGTFLQEVLCGRDACRKNVPRRRWDPRDKRSHCSRCCVPEFPKDHRWRPDFGCAQAPAICSGKLHLWL